MLEIGEDRHFPGVCILSGSVGYQSKPRNIIVDFLHFPPNIFK